MGVGTATGQGGLRIAHLRPPDAEGRRPSAAGGWVVYAGPADSPPPPSPGVAARLRQSLPESWAPSPQSKAQPWEDGVLAQVANLSPPNTFAPSLPLPSLP